MSAITSIEKLDEHELRDALELLQTSRRMYALAAPALERIDLAILHVRQRLWKFDRRHAAKK